MRYLRKGDSGEDVSNWQMYLIGMKFLIGLADGSFGPKTEASTMAFQKRFKLSPDGVVGNVTLGVAMKNGFMLAHDTNTSDKNSSNWPAPPNFKPIYSNQERENAYGKFSYKPSTKYAGFIEVTDNWAKENIVPVEIPQLAKIQKPPKYTIIKMHKKAAEPMKKLWAEWEKNKLLGLIISWEGCYVPRFIRGSNTILSNHAYGTAFDINAKYNPLNVMPALYGKTGSVRELVPIANECGFYWGGHFSRKDGMHFEFAKP